MLGPGLDRHTDLTATPASPSIPAGAVAGVRVSAAEPAGGGGLALRVGAGDEPAAGDAPLVNVVLPAGDDAEQLAVSLASLTAQSWRDDAYEVLLVADASQPVPAPLPSPVRLVPNDGTDPRDTGAAAARGTYLFFLRPGDRLGEEALRRMYDYGLEHDADVVAGKLAGAKRRSVPKELYARDRPSATLAKDPLANSLTAEKLFDREMIRRHGLRFGASPHPLAEQAFTAEAMLRARRTAVLGSYVCCSYAPAAKAADFVPGPYYAGLREMLTTVDRLTGPGPARDRLHQRWLRVEVLERLGGTRLPDLDDAGRRELLGEIRTTLDGYVSPTATAGLSGRQRVTLALVAEDRVDELLELTRWEGTAGCRLLLRDARWPADGTFEVDFTARPVADGRPLELLAGEDRIGPLSLSAGLRARLAAEPLTGPAQPARAKAVLVLRERATGAQYPLTTTCEVVREPGEEGMETLLVTGRAAFDPATVVSGAALADGAWDFHVRLTALGWTRTARLGADRPADPALTLAPRPHPDGDGRTVTPYWTKHQEDLSLRVGRPKPTGTASASPQRGLVTRALGKLRRWA